MFVLPDADFADNADERRSFIVLKENKSAFFCVICARLRPVNTSKHTVKSSFIVSNMSSFELPANLMNITITPFFAVFLFRPKS